MTGYLRQDEENHWYWIAAKEIDKFDDLFNRLTNTRPYTEEWEDLNEEFIDKYSHCMIDTPFTMKFKEVA